jgi:probable HAF family extracellular repeat protein
MQNLGTLGGFESQALGVTPDGNVVVGMAQVSSWDGPYVAFRWTQATGLQNLGQLGGVTAVARGVSADGNVVVGYSNLLDGTLRAFKWTPTAWMQDLGSLDGTASAAMAISSDAKAIVGWASVSTEHHAARWTIGAGIEDLNVTYRMILPAGGVLTTAYGISPNGRYLVGWGFNPSTRRPEAFLLDGYPQPVLPRSYTLLRGAVMSGNLNSLFYSDDQYLLLRPHIVLSQTEAPIQAEISSLCPYPSPAVLRLVVESSVNISNVTRKIEVFHFTTQRWVELDSRTAPTNDDRLEFSLAPSSHYIGPQFELRVRLSFRPAGMVLFYPWQARLDEVAWRVTP